MAPSSPGPALADVVLAIDVGGTKIEAALVTVAGDIVPGSRCRANTGTSGGSSLEAFTAALRDAVTATLLHAPAGSVHSVGIGCAGPIDFTRGTVSPINLPAVRDYGIITAIREATGIDDVRLRLDGTCIALAELWKGAAKGARNAIVFVVSTGIGGGVVSDGRVLGGATGNAGHLGQVVVDIAVGDDAFGATVEGQASGKYTVAWARSQGWSGSTGEELAAAVSAGDPIAVWALERSASALGRGLASVANLLDTDLAVMGGGFSFVTDDYPARVEAVARATSVNAYARQLRVVRAELSNDAPLIGAAAQVFRPELLT